MTPTRVLDTRTGNGLSAVFVNTARNFLVTNGTIPTAAIAVTGNLTVTGQSKAGYVILAPIAGTTTSTLNFPLGDVRANGVTVALSGAGQLNAVYKAATGAKTHLFLDVTGYFDSGRQAPSTSRSLRSAFSTPGRQRRSRRRPRQHARDFQVTNGSSIPTAATGVTGNITVVGQSKAGYVFLAHDRRDDDLDDQLPEGDTSANGVTVALSGTGKLDAVFMSGAGATTNLFRCDRLLLQ